MKKERLAGGPPERRCDWCGTMVPNLMFTTARLVRHKGKMELWCQACVAEDAIGLPSNLHSRESLKRKKDRRTYDDEQR